MTVKAAGCSGANFTQPAGSPISIPNNNPRQVVTTDFNLDGKLDIVVMPTSATGGAVYLGNGNGGFGSAKPFTALGDVLAVGDFNGDGKPDLVSLARSNSGNNKLTILLGDGTGSFNVATGSPFAPPSPADFVTVADFNLDGKLDLAVTRASNTAAVTILLGNGNGGFSAAGSPITVGGFPQDFMAADINLDGKPDLVVANNGANTITILLGDGAGSFSQPSGSPFNSTSPTGIATGDFNLDGKPDLAIASNASLNVQFFLGNGSGGFTKTNQSIFVYAPLGIATADLNLDGLPDLVIADASTGAVILLGDGSGHFTTAANSPISVGNTPESVAVGDFNSDGRPDFAAAGNISKDISIELNTCNAAVNTLQFSAVSYSVNESVSQATISVTRTGSGNGAVSVAYATTNGTAIAGSDYATASGTLNWANGDSSAKTFSVPIINDTLDEADETVNLTLSNPSGGATLGSSSTATLTIVDNDPAPTVSINDISLSEGNAGTTAFNFTVALSAVSGQTVSVNYTTVDGSAQAGSDYQAANDVVSFAPGETSKQITVIVNGDTQVEPNETFAVNLYNLINAGVGKASGLGTIVNDDSASTTPTIQFSQASYSVPEALGALTITVTRSGDTSAPASVDYKTVDGSAVQKADFEYAAGTLTFGIGQTSKTFQVLINEDMYVEGNESFGLTLSNPAGASLGAQSSTSVSINDDSPESITNPVDDAQGFVTMQYHDFLNREPDASGLAFWTSQITACGVDQACIDRARANVSAAFYLSIEFQQTGYLLYLMQKESFTTVPKYAAFMRDLQEVSRGVVVNTPGWQQKLSDNQQQFAEAWANRPEFKAIYDGMSNTDFVNTLYANAGIVVTQADRDTLVARLDTANETRAAALLDVAANAAFRQSEQNGAFVLMEYFGYLRRDPNTTPDSDMSGYNFWLNKLNQFGGSYIDAEMVRAFIISSEYRQRFGQ
jgi:hypothetical protein